MTMNYTERSRLDLAQDELAEIDQTIARLQEKRAKVAVFIEMWGQFESPEPMSAGTPIVQHFSPMAPVDRQPLNIRIGNFVETWLAGSDEPAAIGLIFEALQGNKLVPGGTNPKQALSAILGKDKRFQYKQGVGWSRVPRLTHPVPRETL